MDLIFAISLILSVSFSIFLLWVWRMWLRIQIPESSYISSDKTKVSLIAAARNEDLNIRRFLQSLSEQDYSADLIEIIIADDQSTDRTVLLIKEFAEGHPDLNLRIVEVPENSRGSKKEALTLAVNAASNEIIAVADADCRVSSGWISSMLHAYRIHSARFLAGPVVLESKNSLFGLSQGLEFMGLVGIAAAGIEGGIPIMCNGANMMFSKKAFLELGGFESKNKISSGDDTQLLLKMSNRYDDSVFFLKDPSAIVYASAPSSFGEFINQRKRWAGKIPFALNTFTIGIAILAWLTHFFLLLSLIGAIVLHQLPVLLLISAATIVTCEFLLLNSLARFFKRSFLLWLFLPLQIIYLIYIVGIGLLAPFGKYLWKGRMTK